MRLIDKLMSEVAFYGGIPMRRSDILRAASEDLGEQRREPFGAQYFAFHGPCVDADPWTLEQFKALRP